MSTDKKVKVQINDMNFYVVGEEDSDYIKSLSKTLNDKIRKIQNSNYKLNQIQCLTLTALNILDEKEKLKLEQEKINQYNKDSKLYRESLRRIEELENINKSNLENKEKNDSLIMKLRNENKVLEEDNRVLRRDKMNKNSEFEEMKTEIESLKKEKQNLNRQIYESQKRIMDLNREIENINEN